MFLSDPIQPADAVRFEALLVRRSARVPLQHLVGEAPFRHLVLEVGRGVFVPRPETEGVVELAIRALSADSVERLAVDLCTGSGAIALAIATEVPDCVVHAVEIEEPAYAWAVRNVAAHADRLAAVGSRVVLHRADATTAHLDELAALTGRVDLVVSNPPYIPDEAVPREPEVRDYDPPRALYGGHDGLDVVRGIAVAAAALLRPGGVLVVEHGDAQGESAGAAGVPQVLLDHGGFVDVVDHPDLAGRDRATVAVRARAGGAADGGGSATVSLRFDTADPTERAAGIEAAASAARRGDLVVLPTDTVYGLGCDAFSPAGVSRLLAAKGRGRDMPVPVLVGSPDTIEGLAYGLSPAARDLVEAFWPGAVTVVVRHQPSLAWDLGDAQGTVALRMPLHPVAIELLQAVGPMAVSSANRSGAAPATTYAEAEAQLGESVAVYLDAGTSGEAVPSTIVDVAGAVPRLLRLGAVDLETLRSVCPDLVAD